MQRRTSTGGGRGRRTPEGIREVDEVSRPDLLVSRLTVPAGVTTPFTPPDDSRRYLQVLHGGLVVTADEEQTVLAEGEGLHLPPLTRHRIANGSESDTEVLLVATPRPRQRHRTRASSGAHLYVGSHLRATRESDLDAVVAIEEATDTRAWLGPGGRDWHRDALADPDREHWVLVDRRGTILGFGVLADLTRPDRVEIRRMVILPEGRGQGLGRLLFRKLLQVALASPRVRTVWLDVSTDNTRAIAIYRGFGFVEKDPPSWARMEPDGTFMQLTREV